jgi:hypothetical protein
MDQEALLALLQNDIGALNTGVETDENDKYGDDDDISSFEAEFRGRLQAANITTTGINLEAGQLNADLQDQEWNDFMISVKDVDSYFEEIQLVVHSIPAESGGHRADSFLEFATENRFDLHSTEPSVVVEVPLEVGELMEEILAAVERSAPLITASVTAVDETLSQNETVPILTDFVEEEYNCDSAVPTAEFSIHPALYETLRLEDAAKAAAARKQIEMEEERMAVFEREARWQLEQKLAEKESRRLRREEELKKAQEAKLRSVAAVSQISGCVNRVVDSIDFCRGSFSALGDSIWHVK